MLDRLFFDGECGLCHRAVRFVSSRERSGREFRFAPLDGATFRRLIPRERRAALPDSLVVLTGDGQLLDRSQAVVHVLRRLCGAWPLLGRLLELLPTSLADAAYDRVARHRARLSRPPVHSCPIPGPEQRRRFDP